MINDNFKRKNKFIKIRVTSEQKETIACKAKEHGFSSSSEYILTYCLKECTNRSDQPPYLLTKLRGNLTEMRIRMTIEEKERILERYKLSGINNVSRFVRNCCMNNSITVINDLKIFTTELNRIGNNLNQLTMLCHQGLIDLPDISETKLYLNEIYKTLINLNTKDKLSR